MRNPENLEGIQKVPQTVTLITNNISMDEKSRKFRGDTESASDCYFDYQQHIYGWEIQES